MAATTVADRAAFVSMARSPTTVPSLISATCSRELKNQKRNHAHGNAATHLDAGHALHSPFQQDVRPSSLARPRRSPRFSGSRVQSSQSVTHVRELLLVVQIDETGHLPQRARTNLARLGEAMPRTASHLRYRRAGRRRPGRPPTCARGSRWRRIELGRGRVGPRTSSGRSRRWPASRMQGHV